MADIFDEVSEDLRAERAQRLLRQYGYLLVVAAVLIVAGAGGWQAWRWKARQGQDAVATAFIDASRQASERAQGATATEAAGRFATIAADARGGYRTLAWLREAALRANGGDLPGALQLWDRVSADERADPDLRRLADLLWVQHQVDAGDPAAVEGRLAPLVAPGGAWRPLALESQALLKLRAGDAAAATAVLRELVALPSAPPGVRARAGLLLARLGEPVPDGTAGTEG